MYEQTLRIKKYITKISIKGMEFNERTVSEHHPTATPLVQLRPLYTRYTSLHAEAS